MKPPYLILAATALAGLSGIAAASANGGGLAICSRCVTTTMVSLTGIDTNSARAVATVTKADVDNCSINDNQCGSTISWQGRRIEMSANCVAGAVTDRDGERFDLVGLWGADNIFAGQPKFRDRSGAIVGTANAEKGGSLAVNYEKLCPSVRKKAKAVTASASPVEIGRQTPVEIVDLATLDGLPYDHNGSIVIVDADKGVIVYQKPKKAIRNTVKPGTVLFRGSPWSTDQENVVITGSARAFKKGCKAAVYDVRGLYGQYEGMQRLTLKGAAPVRLKASCALTGHTISSSNAILDFVAAWGE